MYKSSTLVIWSGPSLWDSQPIVVLASGFQRPSMNRKTGFMIQTYILRQEGSPITNIQSGADSSICGDCPLRKRVCYVDPRASNNIWRMWERGDLDTWKNTTLPFPLRLGAYGDPAMVPLSAWLPLINKAPGWTGYTHRWRDCDPEWRNYLHASVESYGDLKLAHSMGWATYRVAIDGELPIRGEQACLYSVNKTQCSACLKCNGNTGKNIVIPVHGVAHKIQVFNKLRSAIPDLTQD